MSSVPWKNSNIETWLSNVISSCISKEEVENKKEKLKELLISSESNETLQYPIYELLGEKSFHVIETLLKYRENIIYSLKHQTEENEERKEDEQRKQEQEEEKEKENKYHSPLSEKSRYIHSETVNGTWYTVEATKLQRPNISHIPIQELPVWSRKCFLGCETLNDIQSIVYKSTQSNENLLICAPTGSGKTNVALLCIINEIKKHLIEHKHSLPTISNNSKFLIVYLTPMKALATEITHKLSTSLQHLKINVKEYTGDTHMSSFELERTQILVATPEKWDVATRRSGEGTLSMRIKLLIIDEIHLLQDERGPVIEALVARTLRQVEQTQKIIRIIGLSATLPNYQDVANFLHVNKNGLYIFGPEFRPVPLAMTLIGAKNTNLTPKSEKLIYEELYKPGREKDTVQIDCIAIQLLRRIITEKKQVLVFVHTRNETIKFAELIIKYLDIPINSVFNKELKHKNIQGQVKEILSKGVGIHHAGLPRNERIFIENSFRNNSFSILICTATLAWGVNLPAHTVIIKDTKIYNQEYGGYENIGILDVHQMFGRAGRPQFDKDGHGILISTNKVLQRYTTTLINAESIKSNFHTRLEDFLNAEISLGTVTSKQDALKWLHYTFMYQLDPDETHYTEILNYCINELTDNYMIHSSLATESLHPTYLGQIASLHYIPFTSICYFNEKLHINMSEEELLDCIFSSGIFQSLLVRRSEVYELEHYQPLIPLLTPFDELSGKVNILFQSYISRYKFKTTSLTLDQTWLSDNLERIFDAIFELTLERGWSYLSKFSLNLCKMVEHQLWWCQEKHEHPLKQFLTKKEYLPTLHKLENISNNIKELKEIEFNELKQLLRNDINTEIIYKAIQHFPIVEVYSEYQPIKENINLINIELRFPFEWENSQFQDNELFWLFIEEPDGSKIYYSQEININKRISKVGLNIKTYVPNPNTQEYLITITSIKYLGVEDSYILRIEDYEEKHKIDEIYYTKLSPKLKKLPITIIENEETRKRFSIKEFNLIQTQLFYQTYHSNESLLLCSPSKTGKSIIGELGICKVLEESETSKIIYIISFHEIYHEYIEDFKKRYKNLTYELEGNYQKDLKNYEKSRIIFSTAKKWDSFSYYLTNKHIKTNISLIILDELELIGNKNGHIYENIIYRIRNIINERIRIIGLSTPLSNVNDIGQYLRISKRNIYNFNNSTRIIPLMVFIQGFPGRQYYSRMAAMNKPLIDSILQYSKGKSTLIFVPSKKQTIITAIDLISSHHNSIQFLNTTEELIQISKRIDNKKLSYFLTFGIGIYHKDLTKKDKEIIKELFKTEKLIYLICTSNYSFTLNISAHFVIIKGTEYYDKEYGIYKTYELSELQQMIRKSGRYGYDTQSSVMILCEETRLEFLKTFINESFPVESTLLNHLSEYIKNEISNNTIRNEKDIYKYISNTYFSLRLYKNPLYYNNKTLQNIIKEILEELKLSQCYKINENKEIESTNYCKISSYYNISHLTVRNIIHNLQEISEFDIPNLLLILCKSKEFERIQLRHLEEDILQHMKPRFIINDPTYLISTKVFYIIEYYLSQKTLPTQEFKEDLKIIQKYLMKIIDFLIEIMRTESNLQGIIKIILIKQMNSQGIWWDQNPLQFLMKESKGNIRTIPELILNKNIPKYFNNIKNKILIYSVNSRELTENKNKFYLRLRLISGEIGNTIYTINNSNNYNNNNIKYQQQNLYIFIGNPNNNKIYAFQRIQAKEKNIFLTLQSKEIIEENSYLYIFNDSYIGIDQMYSVNKSIIKTKMKENQNQSNNNNNNNKKSVILNTTKNNKQNKEENDLLDFKIEDLLENEQNDNKNTKNTKNTKNNKNNKSKVKVEKPNRKQNNNKNNNNNNNNNKVKVEKPNKEQNNKITIEKNDKNEQQNENKENKTNETNNANNGNNGNKKQRRRPNRRNNPFVYYAPD